VGAIAKLFNTTAKDLNLPPVITLDVSDITEFVMNFGNLDYLLNMLVKRL
jgi:hypothetical protein